MNIIMKKQNRKATKMEERSGITKPNKSNIKQTDSKSQEKHINRRKGKTEFKQMAKKF